MATSESCNLKPQSARTPGIWNPLPHFTDVKVDGELGNIKDTSLFFSDLQNGTLPAVVWLAPSNRYSEHPPGLVSTGQSYVVGIINAIARSKYWNSTAIFLSWDDWGGFYDHVRPPDVSTIGYGLRVPGLVISAYARKGFVDHQLLSHDAYVKFIEDDFLNGARLDPRTDNRPDSRTVVAENAPHSAICAMTSTSRSSRVHRSFFRAASRVHTNRDIPAHHSYANRFAERAFARAATSSRSRGAEEVDSDAISSRADEVMSCTARSNASAFVCDGLVNPEIFRTNCRLAFRISSSVAGGSKLKSGRILRHMRAPSAPLGDRPPLCDPHAHRAQVSRRQVLDVIVDT